MTTGWHGTILCGVDAQPSSRAALRTAAAFARRLAWRLVLVHVQPGDENAGPKARPDGARTPREAALAEAGVVLRRLAEDAGCDAAVALRPATGDPAACLVACAEEERADLIVVGSRARGTLRSSLFGSVARELCRRASCPVLVVGPPRAPAERGPRAEDASLPPGAGPPREARGRPAERGTRRPARMPAAAGGDP